MQKNYDYYISNFYQANFYQANFMCLGIMGEID